MFFFKLVWTNDLEIVHKRSGFLKQLKSFIFSFVLKKTIVYSFRWMIQVVFHRSFFLKDTIVHEKFRSFSKISVLLNISVVHKNGAHLVKHLAFAILFIQRLKASYKIDKNFSYFIFKTKVKVHGTLLKCTCLGLQKSIMRQLGKNKDRGIATL